MPLAIEVFVGLSLMEMPPFGRGGSDIIWALPFFAMLILALEMPGLLAALAPRVYPHKAANSPGDRPGAKRG